MEEPTIDPAGIAAMERRIRPHIRRTPTLALSSRDLGLDPSLELVLKLEALQHAGSFKARGAFANLLCREVPKAGVVAASGGNHGIAVAFAANRAGVPATIFVPAIASPAKTARIQECGAKLVVGGDAYADAFAASERWAAQSGAMPVHAYDHPITILGAGTLAAELEEQASGLDTLLVSVGGGGLIAGIAAWYRGRTRVIGVETEGCPTLHAALRAGKPVDVSAGGLAADSLGAKRIGEHAFPLVRAHAAGSLLVGDGEIREAQRRLWSIARIVAEPGAAAGLAALLSGRYRPQAGERVGLIVCGANTTAVDFGH